MQLPKSLRSRLHITQDQYDFGPSQETETSLSSTTPSSFILYLPTVVLRKQQNPAFALAVRLANHLQLPLIVLGVVLDDTHHHIHLHVDNDSDSNKTQVPVVNTARKLAFTLQAYQQAASEWSTTGAAVLLRVHGGPRSRTPFHLTLARQAAIVVTDEPFVYPYRGLIESVERSVSGSHCYSKKTAVVRVDGSTTVPPVSVLRRRNVGIMEFHGVPDRAWKWHKQTQAQREWHVQAAVRDGELDAPSRVDVACPVPSNALSSLLGENNPTTKFYPKDWLDPSTPAPGRRPWTVE